MRQHSVMEFLGSNHIIAFVNIAANMRLHSCCFTIACTLPTLGIAEVYPFYADAVSPAIRRLIPWQRCDNSRRYLASVLLSQSLGAHV